VRRSSRAVRAVPARSSWSPPAARRGGRGTAPPVPKASIAASFSERAPSEPPKHQHTPRILWDVEAAAGGGAVGGGDAWRDRGRPPHLVAGPVAAVEGEARGTPCGANGREAAGFATPRCESASVRTSGTRRVSAREAHRSGHVAAAAEDRVGAPPPPRAARARPTAARGQARPPRAAPQRVAAVEDRPRRAGGTGSRRPARARPPPARRLRTRT